MKIITTYEGNSINLMQKKYEQNHNIACHVEMVVKSQKSDCHN